MLYLESVVLDIHVYKLHPEVAVSAGTWQGSEDGGGGGGSEYEGQPSSKVTVLPSKTLDGLWEL